MITTPTLIALLLLFIVIFVLCYKKIFKENYSYHFGFPTWGGVYNRLNYPQFQNPYNYNSVFNQPINPFMLNYYPNYLDNYVSTSILPYMTERCYSSSKHDQCVPGHYKVNDGGKCKNCHHKHGSWKCCRYW